MTSRLKRLARALLPRSVVGVIQERRRVPTPLDPEVGLLAVLGRGRTFLDVGANRGSWSVAASALFAEVHAFEPVASIADVLRAAAPANVIVHELALSDHDGTGQVAVPVLDGKAITTRASLESGANPGFDDETVQEVRLARLDGLGLQDVDVVKIDVEGHERATLDGAWETLDRDRPSLIVEIEERHHPGGSEAIIDSLRARGYLCCYLVEGSIDRFRPGSIDELQPPDLIVMPGQAKPARYVNNFIFVPEERSHEIEEMERLLAGEAS